ncbi:MAG: TonB-dependent receptor [Prevotella sp.]|nr:TonB-dependent receptor [Prevotella sp.]
MMKQVKITMPRRALTLVCGLALATTVFGQQVVVKGHVVDATGEPVIGATVRVDGQQGGTVTDLDGNFTLNANSGATVTVDYIGYESYKGSASSNMSITLHEGAEKALNEVVVIGYGAVKKSDLTGSVTALKPDSKNKGLVVNPQDMISGKIAGVSVTSSSGAPGAGSTIRIRGGSSLNASNDPLIVIDGVAMDNNGVKGLSNPLSMINPQDIESFNVLKDASATAIYGSRGSNGVIIITTKKGHKGQKPTVSYAGSFTVSKTAKTVDVMDGDEFRNFIKTNYGESSSAYAALGSANTDWQSEIYRTALSHDHNVTVAGSLGSVLPYRVSVGYTSQQGILKTSDFNRYTGAINLSPSLLNDHLTFNINAKGMWAKTKYANTAAIGAAVYMDPTQSVYDYTSSDAANFGNYFGWKSGASFGDSAWPNTLNSNATDNPVALLYGTDDRAISRSFIGNTDVDYKVHGFEDLRLHLTLGAELSDGKQTTDKASWAPDAIYYGSTGFDRIFKRNLSLSAYAQYFHDFKDAARNHFDIMAGYEWQHFYRSETKRYYGVYPSTSSTPGAIYEFSGSGNGADYDGDGVIDNYIYKTENYLVSFFGRTNWSLMDRYYVTFTLRDDGSSRFKDHWALFPSAAFAWRMKDENKFKEINWLSDLKLRLGWGMTGQQEGIGDYNYFAIYSVNSGSGSYYPIVGNGSLYRPDAYDANLKWETTTTYNIGLDWGLWNQRFTGSVDWYYRETTDLINYAYVSAGSNFANQVNTNIGSLYNTGVETQLHFLALNTKNWRWTMDYNFTYNKNRISKLINSDPSYYVATGKVSSGTGTMIQAHAVGHPANSFYVYQQVYDEDGNPLEGVYVDRNGDGVISEKDKYFYKSPAAPVTMGFASRLEYKNWDLGFALRASIGNYVYNDLEAGSSNVSTAQWSSYNYLSNRPIYTLAKNWQTYDNPASDYFVHNASFLKMDNITLGYSFDQLFKSGGWHGLAGRLYGTVNNVFTITKYNGIDPEVFDGIDNNIYPRPISFIVGLNLTF